MKVQITLDDKLMARLDTYAENNYMSRSGLVSLCCTQYLNQVEAITAIREISLILRKVADEGKMDEDTLRQLEDYERLCKMIRM